MILWWSQHATSMTWGKFLPLWEAEESVSTYSSFPFYTTRNFNTVTLTCCHLKQKREGGLLENLENFLNLVFNENKAGSAEIEQMMRNDLAKGSFLPLRWYRGRRRRARGPSFPSLFLSLSLFFPLTPSFSPFFFLPSISALSLSAPLTPLYRSPSSSSLSQNMKSFASSQPQTKKKEKKRKKRKNFLSNNSDALLNLINEAWETWSYNTLVSIKEHRLDWLLPDAAGCLWTKRTHTCNPFGFGATLSAQWVPTELSLSMTDCTLTSQGVEERYSLFMKSKMENPFTQADS